MNNFLRDQKQNSDSNLTVELLDSVKLWADNPRINHQLPNKLGKLLMLYGQISPVVVWRQNKVIYKGNSTWKALNWWRKLTNTEYLKILDELKLSSTLQRPTTIKVLWQDFKDEQEAISYGIADNKAGEWTFWDDDKLERLLKKYYLNIENSKISTNISSTGFSLEEINKLVLLPKIDKMVKQSETKNINDLNSAVKIKCLSEVKDELKDWLLENLKDYGFDNTEII